MKSFLSLLGSRSLAAPLEDVALLLLRLFVGLSMALAHGWGKIPPSTGFIGFVESLGFPAPALFAWLAALGEFVGGLLLAAGLLTRFAALNIIITMGVAAFMAHASDGFAKQELPLLYLIACVFFLVSGGGKFSADRALSLR